MPTQPIIRVAVPSPLRRFFDYLPCSNPSRIRAGSRVLVPFGQRRLVGVVMECGVETSIEKKKLKPILEVLDDEPVFSEALFRTLRWAISYYQHPPGEVLATALPAGLRSGNTLRTINQAWFAEESNSGMADSLLKNSPRQKLLYKLLRDRPGLTSSKWLEEGFSRKLLDELNKKKLIIERALPPGNNTPWEPETVESINAPVLNNEQQAAVTTINSTNAEFQCFLLNGVTGSGKTEVYMHAIQQQLQLGRQCLVLVPEIGLTPQTVSRFENRFSCPIVSLHSGLTQQQRLARWRLARNGEAAIVIGTRSAVFTPLKNPGLIIVDEEHDASFKQQDGFRYSARDLAIVRAREEEMVIILGSATPSLESLHNSQEGKYTQLNLSSRAGGAQAAIMETVDVTDQSMEQGFSEELLQKIQRHLSDNNQVLVFINRRGFAPLLHCVQCGWIAECENCVTQFTVHTQPASLRCHHCSVSRPLPDTCPQCHGNQLDTLGMGTQRAERFLQERFASIPVLRIDRDSTRSQTRFDAMLDIVHRGEPCILLGTQMLAKGHHFPNITLAIILNADAGLFSADFRGQEYMGQTILQVAGRAGRAEKPGEVVIQSRHTDHESLQKLSSGDYELFSDYLMQERRQAIMPPFSHLCLLRAEAKNPDDCIAFLEIAASHSLEIKQKLNTTVQCIGPMPSPMEKRGGRYRMQILYRSEQRPQLQAFLAVLSPTLEATKATRTVRWNLDVDPIDMI